MSKLNNIILQRESIRLQMEANQKLLEAACVVGNAQDMEPLRVHAHKLLDQSHHLTADYYIEFHKQLGK